MTSDGVALLVVGLLAAGVGAIFLLADRASRSSRALALCLLAMGARLLLAPLEPADAAEVPRAFLVLTRLLEACAILAGIEWGRRIGEVAAGRLRRTVNLLFRGAQLMTLVFAGLLLGYVLIFPQTAATDMPGFTRVRAAEWAVFAPVLGTALLLSAMAIALLLLTRRDAAEAIRLRALLFAAPFLLAGLVIDPRHVPVTLALGLLIFLAGSVRYLVLQTRRGEWMGRFVSPELSTMLRGQGMEQLMQRQRRTVSIVLCDIRGFTAFAAARDSETVVGLLEDYYHVAGTVAAECGATVKDHAGDGILMLVGAPLALPDAAERAVRLARGLVARARPVLREADAALGLGVGIATGEVTVGAIQGAGRLEYVAVGSAVNLAARLCQRAADGEILLDRATVSALTLAADAVRAVPPEPLKGFGEAVTVFALTGGADADAVRAAGAVAHGDST